MRDGIRLHTWVLVVLAAAASLTLPGAHALAADAGSQLKVGLIELAGGSSGPSVQRSFHRGFVAAVRRLGLEGDVRVVAPGEDPLNEIAFFARQNYDLVVTGALSPQIAETVDTAAVRYPQLRLLVLDLSHNALPHKPKNVQGLVFRAQGASYLAGYLAALMERRRPGRDMISSVGGFPVPPVVSLIAGYQAGAKRADRRIKTPNVYSDDFVAPAKCRSLALAQIANGSGVVFDVAGRCGEGALQAAKQKRVFGIGVDFDHAYLGSHILTSVVKRYDVVLYRALGAFRDGKLPTGGTTVVGLRHNEVALGKISPKVPRSFLRRIDRIRAEILAGRRIKSAGRG
jgi:basic membrane protein A and related proteins